MRMSIGRRLMWVAAVLAAGPAVAVAQPAQAYTPRTYSGCGGANQPYVRFTDGSDVHMVVHYGESHLEPFDNLFMLAAINEVNAELNAAGGTSVHVTVVQWTSEPFKWGLDTHGNQIWYTDDLVPTIHVGFVPWLDDGAAGSTYAPIGSVGKCHYQSASIAILDTDALYALTDKPGQTARRWNFKEPGYYYLEGLFGAGTIYFRQSYLHEMLHAFGLAHSANTYSYLNYGERPWANRPAGHKARPLPDDVRGLRNIYPASGTRYDVALLNTWYVESNDPEVPADQDMLCRPGRGKDLGPSIFEPEYCGSSDDPAPDAVCKGQNLNVWFALANYSTSPVSSSVMLYFSTDDVWNYGDIASSSYLIVDQTAAQSSHKGATFEVPDLPGAKGTRYYPILRALAVPDGPVPSFADWMPLTGTVTVGDCA
jgi:hypothetical protein